MANVSLMGFNVYCKDNAKNIRVKLLVVKEDKMVHVHSILVNAALCRNVKMPTMMR